VNSVSIPYELKSLRRNFEFPRKLPSAAKADVDFNGLLGTVKTVPFQNGFFPLSLKRRRFFALFAKTRESCPDASGSIWVFRKLEGGPNQGASFGPMTIFELALIVSLFAV
jgi:hypothetical protein